ncbi:hypothetical protein I3679_014825 [Proteus mirabilis]|uniref:Fimbrial subunit n=1 Tax=Proteus mirabilis TaxID=584 RepID=A0ABD5LYR1_PROMI
MRYYHYILGTVMLAMSAVVNSATINLTAKFTPAINNSNSDGIFTNTTPEADIVLDGQNIAMLMMSVFICR